MTEQLDLEDWLRDNPANSDDTDNSLKNNEKWKNEELEEDNYYIKDEYGNIIIAQYLPEYDYDHQDGYALDGYRWYALGFDYDDFDQDSVVEVLAPVPSYEEWRRLQSSWVDEMGKAVDLQKALEWSNEQYNTKVPVLESENQQLKELLKECGEQLYDYSDVCLQEGYELEREEVLKLKTKIDNAIGEKK